MRTSGSRAGGISILEAGPSWLRSSVCYLPRMDGSVKLMDEHARLPRTVRGKRPDFFTTPGVDDAMSMILVLAQELTVLRERLDSAELVAARHGIPLAAEIEALQPDAALLAAREAWRQSLFDRLFHVASQRRAELEQRHTSQAYTRTLDEIAQR